MRTAFVEEFAPDMIGEEINGELSTSSLFGYFASYKCDGRTEPQFLACLRILITGKRLVCCCAFSDALAAYREWHPRNKRSVTEVVWFIFQASQEVLTWMVDHNRRAFHRIHFPNTAVWVPAGWLVWERSGNEGCCGIRISGYLGSAGGRHSSWQEIKLIREHG